VTLASHPPGESPKSANARDLLQNMSLNRVEDFFIADVGFAKRVYPIVLIFALFAAALAATIALRLAIWLPMYLRHENF